jgi:hypothetical protein
MDKEFLQIKTFQSASTLINETNHFNLSINPLHLKVFIHPE